MNYYSSEELEKFLEFEEKFSLFEMSFLSFSVWSSYRVYFYIDYMKCSNGMNSTMHPLKVGIDSIKKLFILVLNSNFRKIFSKYDVVILEHSRKIKGIDPVSNDILKTFTSEKLLKISYSFQLNVTSSDDCLYLDVFKIFTKILSKCLFWVIPNLFFEKFAKFCDILGIYQRTTLYKRYIVEFVFQFLIYSLFFRIWKPKTLFVSVWYLNSPLICAAKKCGVFVIEVQHGVISHNHIGYNFYLRGIEKSFIPDYIVTFSKYWNDKMRMPFSTRIKEIGNSFFIPKRIHLMRQDKSILFLGQTTISDFLIEFLFKNIEDMKAYKIYFKLHPHEYGNWKLTYPKLVGLQENYINLKVIEDSPCLFDLFNICGYQIGVYSTTIYEGLSYDCRTLILNIPESISMHHLVKERGVVIVSPNDRLVEGLSAVDTNKEGSNVTLSQYFSKFNKYNLFSVIER
jgi:hypothetical protein